MKFVKCLKEGKPVNKLIVYGLGLCFSYSALAATSHSRDLADMCSAVATTYGAQIDVRTCEKTAVYSEEMRSSPNGYSFPKLTKVFVIKAQIYQGDRRNYKCVFSEAPSTPWSDGTRYTTDSCTTGLF